MYILHKIADKQGSLCLRHEAMKEVENITCENINDDCLNLYLDGQLLDGKFAGKNIKAQYSVYNWYLLFLEADSNKLIIYLLNNNGEILDDQVVGHYHYDSLFRNPEILSPDTLEFTFGSRGTVKVTPEPTRLGAFTAKRYLHFEGVTIEA